MNKLSIIIPVYNEGNTIHLILDKVRNAALPNNISKEIIIVNDCSTNIWKTVIRLFDTKILQSLTLKEKRFGFEPEVTAKISRIRKIRIYEEGISYYGGLMTKARKSTGRMDSARFTAFSATDSDTIPVSCTHADFP
ncbi:glycosyltransferase family 2 protein [Flavobacterium pallidum]|uniref:glycosyltransferase family 2 protein n=1 Tax=Flavobacterium pallidum TaxID=2172098 RepID=UPI002936DBD6|nr:glycosyltransferase [Flavobacterium pallidum]